MDKPADIRDIGMIYLLSNFGLVSVIIFLPLLIKERGISDLEIGYLAVIYSVGLFLSNTIFGKMTDNYGRRPFLLLGLLCSAITVISYVFITSFISFGVIRLLNGVSIGMFPAAIYAITSDRKLPMGKLASWRSLGWAMGSILLGFLGEVLQLDFIFLCSGVLFFLNFIFAIVKDTGGTVDRELFVLSNEHEIQPKYWLVIRKNWKIYVGVILRDGSAGAIWVYFVLFLKFIVGLTTTEIGIIYAVNTMTQTIILRYFGDRGDSKYVFLFGLILSSMTFITFPYTSNFIQVFFAEILMGTSFSLYMIGGLRISQEIGAEIGMVGTATGLYEASGSVSQIIGPILAIIVYSIFQTYTASMYFASAVTITTALCYFVLIQLQKQNNEEIIT